MNTVPGEAEDRGSAAPRELRSAPPGGEPQAEGAARAAAAFASGTGADGPGAPDASAASGGTSASTSASAGTGASGGTSASAGTSASTGASAVSDAMEQRVGFIPRRWDRPLRVLLALAGPRACDMARTYLELASGFAVVGTAPNGHRALAVAAEVEPDVAVVDADLPAGGLAVIPGLRRRSPGTVVVALADLADLADLNVARPDMAVPDRAAADAAAGGADVYLGRGTPLPVLTDVLADLAVRLEEESRQPVGGQWPAHVPLPLARWAETAATAGIAGPAGHASERAGFGRRRGIERKARRRRSRRLTVGIAVASVAGTLLSAGAAAAATGSLPAPAQALASRVLADLDLAVPNPEAGRPPGNPGAGRHPTRTAPPRGAGKAPVPGPSSGRSDDRPDGVGRARRGPSSTGSGHVAPGAGARTEPESPDTGTGTTTGAHSGATPDGPSGASGPSGPSGPSGLSGPSDDSSTTHQHPGVTPPDASSSPQDLPAPWSGSSDDARGGRR